MTTPTRSIDSSPPGTPESDDAATSPIPSPWSPVTPLSELRPGISTHISNSKSPLETPNDRRRNTKGAEQNDGSRSVNEISVETVEQYYREQYDGKLQECLKAIRKLERDNNRLSQRPGPEYLLQLEDTIQTLETNNSQLVLQQKNLQLSEQSWRARSERLSVELGESRKELLTVSNLNIGNIKEKHNAENKELIKDLESAREENTELYDKCIALEQENDKFKSSKGAKEGIAERIQLMRLGRHTILSAVERSTIKMELVRLSDQMDQQIETRMHMKGTMFFDQENLAQGLGVKLLEMEELRTTIRSQQDEIEALREREDYYLQLGTRVEPTKDGVPAPVPSLENEFRRRIEVLTQELESTKDQLAKQKSYASALKVFKDQISHPNVGNGFENLNGKIHTMDKMIISLIAKIEELRTEFEARLLESSSGDGFVEARDLAEKLHDVREDCGKLVILSNDIQTINDQAKEESITDMTHGQEASEELKIKTPVETSMLETAREQSIEYEQHGSNNQKQETRVLKSEPKTFMERLWANLNDGGKYIPNSQTPQKTHHTNNCLSNRQRRRPNLAFEPRPRIHNPRTNPEVGPANHRQFRAPPTTQHTSMDRDALRRQNVLDRSRG